MPLINIFSAGVMFPEMFGIYFKHSFHETCVIASRLRFTDKVVLFGLDTGFRIDAVFDQIVVAKMYTCSTNASMINAYHVQWRFDNI